VKGFVRQLGWGLVTLWGASVVTFALLFVLPRLRVQDVPSGMTRAQAAAQAIALTIAGNHADKTSLEGIISARGLDKPLWVQYGRFVADLTTNNLKSYRNDDRVMSAIARRLPATLVLACAAVAVWLLVSVPLGLLTAKYAGTLFDRSALFVGLLVISVPAFWLGRLLQHYLGYELGLFGVGGGFQWANLPLPALTLGLGGAAYYSRLFHANLRGVLSQEFIRAARARGLSERQVLGKHALKNALIPVVAVLGLDIASLLSGLVITEKIFAWPGIGSLAVDSVGNGDLPMILGTVMWAAVTVVAANLLVDIAYRLIDPRVRLNTL
jgi:peptide/nickel transport system permease protein